MRQFLNSILTTCFLLFALLMLGTLSAQASDRVEVKPMSRSFVFNGQNEEILDLSSETIRFRQVEESYQSTCTRSVPYEVPVCHDETEYREENCRWQQPRENCQSVPRQVCSTQYEQQCGYRNEQVCSDIPRQRCENHPQQICQTVTRYRQECRRLPGPPSCQIINGRRVCQPGPGQQVCQNVPVQEQVCHTENRQVCNSYPERVCRMEPRYYCDQVPRNVCRTEYERQCTTIPGERICDRVPHTVPVCHNETRTREESYACTQTRMVEKPEVAKLSRARVNFSFESEARLSSDMSITATLSGEDLKLSATGSSNTLVWAQRRFEKDGEDQIINVHLFFLNRGPLAAPFMHELSGLRIENRELLFEGGKILRPESVSLRVEIRNRGEVILDRVLQVGEFEQRAIEGNPSKAITAVKLGALGVRLSTLFNKYQVKITLSPSMVGEVINAPEISWIKRLEQEL